MTCLLKFVHKDGTVSANEVCVHTDNVERLKRVRGASLRKFNSKTDWKGKGHGKEHGSGR